MSKNSTIGEVYLSGVPIYVFEDFSSACSNYSYFDFQRLQIDHGLKIANSSFMCKLSVTRGERVRSAYVGVDKISNCGLHIDENNLLIDPCSGRVYGSDGKCKIKSCEEELVQIFFNGSQNEPILLPVKEGLIEFNDFSVKKLSNPNANLFYAMISNSDITLEIILRENNIDIDNLFIYGFSLIEIAILTGKSNVVKYLFEKGAVICKRCDESEKLLLESLKQGNFEISQTLLNYGVNKGNSCFELDGHFDAKELLGCY